MREIIFRGDEINLKYRQSVISLIGACSIDFKNVCQVGKSKYAIVIIDQNLEDKHAYGF